MVETILHGTLIGKIWMPAVTCHKQITVNLTRERARYSGGPAGTFRHVMCSITSDGDFQSCSLTEDSYLEIRTDRRVNGRRTQRSRYIPLTDLPSIADLLTDEVPEYSEGDF